MKKGGEGDYTGHCQIEYLLTWRIGDLEVIVGCGDSWELKYDTYHQATNYSTEIEDQLLDVCSLVVIKFKYL